MKQEKEIVPPAEPVDDGLQAAVEQIRKKRARKKRVKRIVLWAFVGVVLLIFSLPYSKMGAVLLEHWSLPYRPKFLAYFPVDVLQHSVEMYQADDFAVNVSVVKMCDMDDTSPAYCISFGCRTYGRWKFLPANVWKDHPIIFSEDVHDLSCDYHNPAVLAVGDYTVIAISSKAMNRGDVTAEDVFDSLGTEPIVISDDMFSDSNHCWLSMSGDGQSSNALGGSFTRDGLTMFVYAVKDMPEDYVFTFGDRELTAQELQQFLSMG